MRVQALDRTATVIDRALFTAFKDMYRTDIFMAISDSYTAEDTSWTNCIGICTVGASAILGDTEDKQFPT
jgi:hypothetical protein